MAARRPVAGLIYLNAFVPEPGISLRDRWRGHPDMFVPGSNQGLEPGPARSTAWADLDGAITTLFNAHLVDSSGGNKATERRYEGASPHLAPR